MRGVNRAAVAIVLSLAVTYAVATEVLFSATDRSKTVFPSDAFTVLDLGQNTLRRVNLAKPDCAANQVRCDDIDVLNTLDGFNPQPRITIPFSGPIDVSTVSSESIFLVSLGSTTGGGSIGEKVGINQAVWDPDHNTLYVESDKFLDQHTRYAVIVTNKVKDTDGKAIKDNLPGKGDGGAAVANEVVEDVLQGLLHAGKLLPGTVKVVAASVFTTQSVTNTLEKVRNQIKASHPAAARFDIGTAGERAVFPIGSVTRLDFLWQDTAAGPLTPASPPVPFAALFARPGVGAIAFGSYVSPNYLAPGEYIPQVPTRTGTPVGQGTNTIYFNLVLPAGVPPAAGWPVAIYGHGFTDHHLNSPYAVAASMAERGIATIAINVVGHGRGPRGVLVVNRNAGTPVTVPAGGRGIDQNGDGLIGSTEGSGAAAPRTLIGSADALRQTVVDLMQLVRVIQVGVDVDGDGAADLDASRIYYFGQSFGGMYGTIFLGVERDVMVGAPNVPGGSVADIIRLSPAFRALFNAAAAARAFAGGPTFDENLPFRNQPLLVNTVPDAIPLQEFVDQLEWGAQVGNPVSYARYIRKAPLAGNAPKSVIYQFARGDQTVPNPTASAIIRAGEFEDRATYYRADLARAAGSPVTNPHTFLTNISPAFGPIASLNAFQAQAQTSVFFQSGGTVTIDPDGVGPLFETPIVLPLPETLNFFP